MNKFLIVTNELKDKDGKVTNRVRRYLESKGKECCSCKKDRDNRIIKESIPEDVDCCIMIGGDGSLIEAAKAVTDVPILGVNMGTLGYLTETEVNYVEAALNKIIAGKYFEENRMMLTGKFHGGEVQALNEIVVTRKGHLRIIHFNLYVNGMLLYSYRADGIIISTPTGSTAYNMSAGGPIVEPTAQVIIVTPICPHDSSSRSILLSADDEIAVEIGVARGGETERTYLSFDGADNYELTSGQRVTINRSEHPARLIKTGIGTSFLQRFRDKMKGNIRYEN